jgi:hypothetical protein
MVTFDDSYAKLTAAEERFKNGDYAGAFFDAQMCIELATKALLKKLDIGIRKEHQKKHDIEDEYFETVCKKVGLYGSEDYAIKKMRVDLARARTLMKLTVAGREFAEYGILDIPAKEIFNCIWLREITNYVIKGARDIYWAMADISNKYLKE